MFCWIDTRINFERHTIFLSQADGRHMVCDIIDMDEKCRLIDNDIVD